MAQINKTTAGIMLAAVIGGGAIGATAIPAMAADGTGTSSSSTTAADGYGDRLRHARWSQGGPHQANGKTEEVLTGDTATKVEAAVKAAQPDATIERMETDADGATYEAHITKADGTRATVLLDANFTVTATQDRTRAVPVAGAMAARMMGPRTGIPRTADPDSSAPGRGITSRGTKARGKDCSGRRTPSSGAVSHEFLPAIPCLLDLRIGCTKDPQLRRTHAQSDGRPVLFRGRSG